MTPELPKSGLVVIRHQYGISAVIPRTSFAGETSGGVAKCRLFSQARDIWEQGSGEAELETRQCQVFR